MNRHKDELEAEATRLKADEAYDRQQIAAGNSLNYPLPLSFEHAKDLAQSGSPCPTARINKAGISAIADWLDSNTATPHNLHAWFGVAEAEANELLAGFDASIEIRAFQSRSGDPVTLKLQPSWFDWEPTPC